MAVTFGSIGATSVGTGDRAPAIPSGTASGDVVLVLEGISGTVSRAGGSVTSGGTNGTWAEFVENTAAAPILIADWKALTGADTGTYSTPGVVTVTGSAGAMRVVGADTASPFFGSTSVNRTTSATTAAVSLTAVPAGSLLVWFCRAQGTGSTGTVNTPPSGFTVRTPSSQIHHVATKEHSGGDTGSLTATLSASTLHGVLLFAVLPVAVNGTVNAVTATVTSAAPVPAVAGGATVDAVTATGATQAPVPVVSTSAAVEAVTATATTLALAPVVAAAQNATVEPPTATVTATAPIPIVDAVRNATVAGVAAVATAQAHPPTVAIVQNGDVLAVAATATATALIPAVAGEQNATVLAVTGTATVLALVPTVAGVSNPTVLAVAAIFTTVALPPMAFAEKQAPRQPRATITSQDTETDIRDNDAKAVIA